MNTSGRRLHLVVAAMCILLPTRALALDPSQPLHQLHHTAWTAKDGLSGAASCLAQTADGYLWVGTTDGLFRFDGRRFERWRPESGEMPANSISTLHATADGGLWIGYQRGGASFVDRDGLVTNYSTREGLPVGGIRAVAVDHAGVVWISGSGGTAYLEGKRWRRLRGGEWNLTSKAANGLLVDREGTLWVSGANPYRTFFRRKGEPLFQDVGLPISGWNLVGTADGIWLFANQFESSVHAMTIDANGQARADVVMNLPGLRMAVDRDGGAWLAGFDIVRVNLAGLPRRSVTGLWARADVESRIERFTQANGLSGRISSDVLEDREGNIWVATDGGVDRFRRRNLTWKKLEGHPASVAGLVAGHDGQVWATSALPPALRRLQDHRIVANAPDAVFFGHADPDGAIWLTGQGVFWRWKDGTFRVIDPPPEARTRGIPMSVRSMARDRTGRLWVSITGLGEFLYKDGVWTFREILPGRGDLTAIAAHADEDDRVWLAYTDEIARVDNGEVRVFSVRDGLDIGPLATLAGHDRRLWAGGELGLAFFQDDRFHVVRFASDVRFGVITGIVGAPGDGLWLHTGMGIVRVPQAEIDRLVLDPTYRVKEELFDTISDLPDQMHGREVTSPRTTAVRGTDGTLWFVTGQGYARVDPGRVFRNRVPPPVSISAIIADDRRYPPRGEAKLPALTKSIQIDYAALSLSIPERVQFRHRLEGWETVWHDAGPRRSAFYTQLGPGTYRFRVIASNNDGVWNDTGASLAFTIAPAWYQTGWFYSLVALSAAVFLWGIYQFRVRQIAAAIGARFDSRLAERTRIARDLHDTLLQTVQASKIIADEALRHAKDPKTTPDTRRLEQLSEWLGVAVGEGRAALNSLRISSVDLTDLAGAFRSAADSIVTACPAMTCEVALHGQSRPLHPAIREEVFRIGYEAMRNACAHSSGTHLTVAVECGQDLVVRVTDNGTGIPPEVLSEGKAGHFGLHGMRERAADIGATLKVLSSETGTSVILTVPGRVAFRHGAPTARS